jgi:hypothetical protein
MKKLFFLSMVIAASIAIVISFFQPWATIATSATKVSKELTKSAEEGPLADTPFASKFIKQLDRATSAMGEMGDIEIKSAVRGNQIPAMVNNKTSKVALSLVQVFFKDAEGIDKKSYLVYLLPLFAIICAALAALGLKNKLYIAIMALIGGVISIGGLYNLMTMDISSAVVEISIAKGLWNTMYAFLFICLVGIAWLATDKRVKR